MKDNKLILDNQPDGVEEVCGSDFRSSPAIGVALMVIITVILAGIISTFVFSMSQSIKDEVVTFDMQSLINNTTDIPQRIEIIGSVSYITNIKNDTTYRMILSTKVPETTVSARLKYRYVDTDNTDKFGNKNVIYKDVDQDLGVSDKRSDLNVVIGITKSMIDPKIVLNSHNIPSDNRYYPTVFITTKINCANLSHGEEVSVNQGLYPGVNCRLW